MRKKLYRSEKIDMKVEPILKKQVQMAAALQQTTVTRWVETAIKEKLRAVGNEIAQAQV